LIKRSFWDTVLITVVTTDEFKTWLASLRDQRGRGRIAKRLARLALGNFGDYKLVGDGVGELRIDHGPKYRVYFARRGAVVVVLLCGGDKGSQNTDIERAKRLVKNLGALP
jgi:putative addiction module killer protein